MTVLLLWGEGQEKDGYPPISPLRAYLFLDFYMGLIRCLITLNFLVVGHIPVKSFLLVSYFFYATDASSKIFLKDRLIFYN